MHDDQINHDALDGRSSKYLNKQETALAKELVHLLSNGLIQMPLTLHQNNPAYSVI